MVNRLDDPQIFVSCHNDNLAYPEYILTFKAPPAERSRQAQGGWGPTSMYGQPSMLWPGQAGQAQGGQPRAVARPRTGGGQSSTIAAHAAARPSSAQSPAVSIAHVSVKFVNRLTEDVTLECWAGDKTAKPLKPGDEHTVRTRRGEQWQMRVAGIGLIDSVIVGEERLPLGAAAWGEQCLDFFIGGL